MPTPIPQRATRDANREPSPTVILRGNTAHGTAPVFARAAKLTQDENTGRSTLDAELLALAVRQARLEEPVEIVLVTTDAHHSLLFPMPPGLVLAAVVSEWETDPRFTLPPDLTVVAGVGGAKDAIPEGEWLIVDPVRLRVTVAPDAGAVGRMQHRLRPRFRLSSKDEPSRTLNGVEVLVWARVFNEDDVEEAIANGADGFVIDGPGDFLPWEVPDDEPDSAALARLMPVAEAAGGGDVALLTALDAIDIASLVRLAAQCRLRLLLAPETVPLSMPELQLEFETAADAEMDAGYLAAAPRFAALLSSAPQATDESEPGAWNGWSESGYIPFDEEEVMALTLPDVLTVPPFFLFLSNVTEEMIAAAVFAGVRGVVVPPSAVAMVKESIILQE